MDVIQPIDRSFADEHVIGIDPVMRPELPGVWRRRINAFAGRALSDKAMTAEQALRSGMQRLYGLALTSGIVDGLAVTAEPGSIGAEPKDALIQITPGLAVASSGEDISVGRAVRLPLGDIQTILRTDHANALRDERAITADVPSGSDEELVGRLRPVRPREVSSRFAKIAAQAEADGLPRVAVLVAQPVVAEILGRPVDPCGLDPRDDPYVDLQRIDGVRLLLFMWPTEVTSPHGGADYSLPPGGPAQRNRLAYAVFDSERMQDESDQHPWEEWGVPLALLGFRADWTLDYVDRFAVARIGGSPRQRSTLIADAGDERLWQARIDQFTQQLLDLPDFQAATVGNAFARLPPVGILPPSLFDARRRKQMFLPSTFAVTALPVAQSNFNLVIDEAASLAPLDRGQNDAVELLVPVPDEVYEPGLLEIAREDPRFGEAIRDIRADRQRWLIRRQVARRRRDRLAETISGEVAGWPESDLPLEENSPAPHVQVPVEVTRVRTIAAGSAVRTHHLAGAHATLTVTASDVLWVWLSVSDADDLTGLSLSVAAGSNNDTPPLFDRTVFWTPDGAAVMPGTGAAQRQGDLPGERIWTRLEVPAKAMWNAAGDSIDGLSINAVQFGQRGGTVEWGSFGKRDAAGLIYTYVADDAPAGAVLGTGEAARGGWPWVAVADRDATDVGAFGTALTGDVRRAAALDAFRLRWGDMPFLRADLDAVDEGGIGAFLANVDARLKATNDAIDIGFVRARADIYRVRQIMLGADSASRLVTSPALADLALRDESARATSKGISEYLKDSVRRDIADTVVNVGPTPVPTPGPAPTPAPTSVSASFESFAFFAPLAMSNNSSFASFAAAAAVPPPPSPVEASFVASPALFGGSGATAFLVGNTFGGSSVAAGSQAARSPSFVSLNALAAGINVTRYDAFDIQRQIPVAGLIERTVSVAERLTPQPAVQAMNYAIASKAAVLDTLIGLTGSRGGRPTGIALDDLEMAGFTVIADGSVPTLAQVAADPQRTTIKDNDGLPVSANGVVNDKKFHEADYFTAAVQAIDNSIAIMRMVEARVSLFEDLGGSLRELLATIQGSINEAAAYLRSVDVEVAEARHDLLTAQRLRDEDRAAADATNARRASILETRVSAIAWRRARVSDLRDELPLMEVASGLAPNPVALCRREHEEAPDEIHDYVQLLREVPVAWFPAIARAVQRIERLESAHAALRTMLERARAPRILAAATSVTASNRFLQGVQGAMVASRRVVEARRLSVATLDFSRFAALSLMEAQAQLSSLSTVGDLMNGSHRQPALTKLAGEELDGIATIAGCLHESFGEVPAIVRLGWAEMLSSFDRPAPLDALAGLPGWGEVPVELRRELQGFVDWLFSRIDRSNDPARDAINELVRICLLMSAHSPVDKLIPAQLIAPAPARLGSKLFLSLDIARVRRGMTTLIRDDRDQIISRAVIDDIVDGRAQATITQISAAITTITPAMRFQLIGGVAR